MCQKKIRPSEEPESSLLCSEKPVTEGCAESDNHTYLLTNQVLTISFDIILRYTFNLRLRVKNNVLVLKRKLLAGFYINHTLS